VGSGGAIFDQEGVAKIRNSIIWGNTAQRVGVQLFNTPGVTTEVIGSNVQGGWSGAGNIDADPAFDSNYKLLQSSPCKNVGNNTYVGPTNSEGIGDPGNLDWDTSIDEALPKDLGLLNRKIEFIVDMGAYETPKDVN